jgi:hypothetical protein
MKEFVPRILAGIVAAVCPNCEQLSAQGLLVDQASGTVDEIVETFSQIPLNQIAQSFTPSLSAVGFVQLSVVVPFLPGNDQATFAVNLRTGSYNGPILGSTDPVVLVNHASEMGTFYYPANIPLTPGQLYFLEPVVLSSGILYVGYKSPSSYPLGEAWGNGVPSGDAADYWFREGVVVPEPSAFALVGFGLGVIWLCRRINYRS